VIEPVRGTAASSRSTTPTDSYVCRPRPPEQISQAPTGRCLIVADRPPGRSGALPRRLAAQQGTARSAGCTSARPGRSHPLMRPARRSTAAAY